MNQTDANKENGIGYYALMTLALPLLLSNFIQQLYNMADSIIVGKLIGAKALAAVGVSGLIIWILIYFFMGLSIGSGIVASQAYGARNLSLWKENLETSMWIALIAGGLLTFIGRGLNPYLLKWMQVPVEIQTFANTYLSVYFLGMIPMMIFNMGSSILRAIGDTKAPMTILLISTLLNVILDVSLIKLGGAVGSVAAASVMSQSLCAVLILRRLAKLDACYCLRFNRVHFSKKTGLRILFLGAPIGIQSVLQCFSNLYVQSSLYVFGAGIMASSTAYGKIEGLIYMPIEAVAAASSILCGQAVGAQNEKAVQGILKNGIKLTLIMTVVTSGVVFWYADTLMGVFTNDIGIVLKGKQMIQTIVPFYILYGINQVIGGVMRGYGNSKSPMWVVLIATCLFRIVWCTYIGGFIEDVKAIYWCYPISWILTGAGLIYVYRREKNSKEV